MSVLEKIRETIVMMDTASVYSIGPTFETEDQGTIETKIQKNHGNLSVHVRKPNEAWEDVSPYFQLKKG